MLGGYLVSEAGSGYLIVGIEETARSGPEHDPRVYNLVCEKVEPAEIPPDVLVGVLYWERRSRA